MCYRLRLSHVRSAENPADGPSRYRSSPDCRLTNNMWKSVQREFGSSEGHTFDLMALDSNVMKDRSGNSLPHFTPGPFPRSSGVNLFAQDLTRHGRLMQRLYVFLPLLFVGSVLILTEYETIAQTCCSGCLHQEILVAFTSSQRKESL